jgi:hypothetical protein
VRGGLGDEAQSGANRTSSPQSGSGAAVKRAASAVPGGQLVGPIFTAAERTLAVDPSSCQAPRPGIRASSCVIAVVWCARGQAARASVGLRVTGRLVLGGGLVLGSRRVAALVSVGGARASSPSSRSVW